MPSSLNLGWAPAKLQGSHANCVQSSYFRSSVGHSATAEQEPGAFVLGQGRTQGPQQVSALLLSVIMLAVKNMVRLFMKVPVCAL